jgi:hypothetical protein
VYLRWDAENAAITYFIDATLPAMFSEEKLQTPIGQIVLEEDSEEFQIVQWSWDIPSMSNPGLLPTFTSVDNSVSIKPNIEENTIDFSVDLSAAGTYPPVLQGSMNEVFEIVKDDTEKQYLFRYKDEFASVRISGDHLLYGDSKGHLKTMAWLNVTAKNYLMVYSNDLHYGLAAPGDAGDFVMVNNRNEGIKWLAVDSLPFSATEITSKDESVSITPLKNDAGEVYGYDLSAAGISGIPESGDGVLARINGVWQFIEMTDGCE